MSTLPHYILIIILFILFIFSLHYILNLPKEGFESYETCLKQGYPHYFCFYKVPIQAKL